MRQPFLAAAVLAVAATAPGAQAQEVTLRFATTNPPVAHLNQQILHPWAARINAQGKGVVQLDVRDGPAFASPNNYFDRVVEDVAQVAWGIQSVVAGKFVLSNVVTLPFVAQRSESASAAFWRLYDKKMFGAEYDDVQPLFLAALPQAGLHFRKELTKLDDLAGLKVIGGNLADTLSALGATPLSINLADQYEALQRGMADGTAMMYTAFQPFKLGEVTTFHVDTPLGGGSGMVFMMKKRFDGLSAEARKILMANSGEAQSRAYGAFWDRVDKAGRDSVDGKPGHKIVTLTPAQSAAWHKKAESAIDKWTARTPNGAAILAAYRQEIATIEAGK